MVLGVAGLAACSPSLNWREVRLQRLVAVLPCKPDHAQRTVALAHLPVVLEMVGCEASGALFALSHVRLDQPEQVKTARADWRLEALTAMRAGAVQELPFKPPQPAVSALHLVAQGTRPDGSVVVARLLWLAHGPDLFHIAVYGDRPSDESTETLFLGLRLQ